MRAARLIKMVLLLQSRPSMTAAELARELEVSERTVTRDAQALSEAGVPVYAERGRAGGYRLIGGYRTRLTGLARGEAEALFLSGVPGALREMGLEDAASAARLKVSAALLPSLRDASRTAAQRFHLDAPTWFREPRTPGLLPVIADAVWDDRRVTARYRRGEEEVIRDLEPYGLVLKAGVWYLCARVARSGPTTGVRPHLTETADGPTPRTETADETSHRTETADVRSYRAANGGSRREAGGRDATDRAAGPGPGSGSGPGTGPGPGSEPWSGSEPEPGSGSGPGPGSDGKTGRNVELGADGEMASGLTAWPGGEPTRGLGAGPDGKTARGLTAGADDQTTQGLTAGPGGETARGLGAAPNGKTARGLTARPEGETASGLTAGPGGEPVRGLGAGPDNQTTQGFTAGPGGETARGLGAGPDGETARGLTAGADDQTTQGLTAGPGGETARGLGAAPNNQTARGLTARPEGETASGLTAGPGGETARGLGAGPGGKMARGLTARPEGEVARGVGGEPGGGVFRVYRVERFVGVVVGEGRFVRDEGFDLPGFWAERAEQFARSILRDRVVVRLSAAGVRGLPRAVNPSAAREALDAAGAPDAAGWVTVTLPVESEEVAHDQLRALGPEAEVLAPASLRERFARDARRLAELYAGAGPAGA